MEKETNSNKVVISNSITKALLTKEAVASCSLDGETQCGDISKFKAKEKHSKITESGGLTK